MYDVITVFQSKRTTYVCNLKRLTGIYGILIRILFLFVYAAGSEYKIMNQLQSFVGWCFLEENPGVFV